MQTDVPSAFRASERRAASLAGLTSPRPADAEPGRRQAATRLSVVNETGNDSANSAVKMRRRMRQGKRMKRLRKALCWLLCLVMFASAVACSNGKSASGQKVSGTEVRQGKPVVSDGKDRKKLGSSPDCTPEEVAVENNYLSSTEKSRQTELNNKKVLTPQEQQQRDALNRKDAETTKALIDACLGGSEKDCRMARQDAQDKQSTYRNLGYQNPKEMQAGYQQIQQLLNGTSAEAKQTQELYNGMVAAYVRTGMSEEAAKSAVGYQLGAMYIAGGIAGIGAGKVVDEGLVSGVKPSRPLVKPGNGATQAESKPFSGAENAALYPKLKDDLVQQNLNNIAKQDPRLAIAVKGDGTGNKDFSMGHGTRADADKLGMIWVGDGARQTSKGGWISADGIRGYRPASEKPNSPYATTGTQANFETYTINSKGEPAKIGNGHLNITD
jgi:filamentous hemagglutinin